MMRMRCEAASSSACVRVGLSQGNSIFITTPDFQLRHSREGGNPVLKFKEERDSELRLRRIRNEGKLFLSRQQTQHLKMRRPALARDALAADHFQSGFLGKAAQFLDSESEIAMVERFDRRT